MPLMVSLSEGEQRELLAAARGYFGNLSALEGNDTVKSEIAMFQSLVEELEAGPSVSAVNAKKACTYILEAKVNFTSEGAPSKLTDYGEIAATIRHRAIAVRATALSAGRN